ncbi:hypothetical protein VNO77_16742 [Canavalia gladiata]|uniref:Uncharacterized protein n=1 Tax=Canavalia gladiata TaxID=3824 RepID=A0AAN9LLB2_CANGL
MGYGLWAMGYGLWPPAEECSSAPAFHYADVIFTQVTSSSFPRCFFVPRLWGPVSFPYLYSMPPLFTLSFPGPEDQNADL